MHGYGDDVKSQNNLSIDIQTSYDDDGNQFYQSKVRSDENCYHCRPNNSDSSQTHLMIYLHSLKYTGPGWSYETPPPEWAKSDWVVDLKK